MSSPKNLARITLLLFSLITNFGPEHEDGVGIVSMNCALAATPIPSSDIALAPDLETRRISYFQGGDNISLAESTGAIDLTWTAPGDDSDSGRADHYIIRFSNDPLSDANWDQAFEAPNPPAPLDAGTPQAYTLTSLECGRRYHVAVKAFDESGNISPISNVPNIFASGIMAPSLAGAEIDSANGAVSLYANPVEAAMPAFYEFALDSLPTFADPLIDVDLVIDSLVSVTFTQLQDDVVYFWRCRAIAIGRTDSSAWSVVDSFLIYMPDLIAPTVTVSFPNGGEAFEAGSVHTVSWNSSDNVGINSCRIEFSPDNGANWTLLRDWTAAPDSFVWTVPSQPSTQCLVRVSARDDVGNVGNDISDEVFSITDYTPPVVTVHSPNGRERWDVNSQQTLVWADSGNAQIDSFRLQYSTNAGNNWIVISGWTPGNPHNYIWNLPDTPSKRGRVRVSCRDTHGNVVSDVSNQNFTIRDISRPHVAILFPQDGDSLEIGLDTTIVWDATDNISVDSFMIEFTLNAGADWDTVVGWQEGNPGQFAWNIPDVLSGQCQLRVSCLDGYENMSSDTSGLIVIRDNIAPVVSITDPIVGDSITMGWTAFDNGVIAHFLIDYTTDGGQSWVEVASGPGGDSGLVTMPIPGQIPALGIRVTCFDMAENAGADTFTVVPTSADDPDGSIPSEYYLAQSYPNPFNPSATIDYGLPVSSHVTIEIFDITGARVAVLKDEYQEAGNYSVVWNAGDVTSGAYFYRIVAGSFSEAGKATLLK